MSAAQRGRSQWLWPLSGNVIHGHAALQRSTDNVLYLGKTVSASDCFSACNTSRHPCLRWTWHHPTFIVRGWALTCYSVIRHRKRGMGSFFPTVFVPDPSVTSGILRRTPAWGRYGYHDADYSHELDRLHRKTTTARVYVPRAATTVGWDRPYTGLDAAILPGGRALHGAQADAALLAHKSPPGHGLLTIGSSRHDAVDFSAAATMLSRGSKWLKLSALLLIRSDHSVHQGSDYGSDVSASNRPLLHVLKCVFSHPMRRHLPAPSP